MLKNSLPLSPPLIICGMCMHIAFFIYYHRSLIRKTLILAQALKVFTKWRSCMESRDCALNLITSFSARVKEVGVVFEALFQCISDFLDT